MREPVKPEQEDIEHIENSFKQMCRTQFIKYGSKDYNRAEIFYFSGVIMAFNYSVIKWSVALMSGRNILEKFK